MADESVEIGVRVVGDAEAVRRFRRIAQEQRRLTNQAISDWRRQGRVRRAFTRQAAKSERDLTNSAIAEWRRQYSVRRNYVKRQERLQRDLTDNAIREMRRESAARRRYLAEQQRAQSRAFAIQQRAGLTRHGLIQQAAMGGGTGTPAGIRAVGNAAMWAQRRVLNLQNTLFSYRTFLITGMAAMAGRSFIENTIGQADDIHRSRLLLRSALGDAEQVQDAFDSAIRLAREIGPLTRQEALQSMRFMVPLANGNVAQAEELTRLAKALQVTRPEQNFGGALFALQELVGSGQVRSLRERFNISGLPTRTEAEAMAAERGITVAQLYMDEFRAELERRHGRGGTDAVTALLAADVNTVRGRMDMIKTIIVDRLADIGMDAQSELNTTLLPQFEDRLRAFLGSSDFDRTADRLSRFLVDGATAAIDIAENLPQAFDRAEQFLDRHGDTLILLAKLHGINLLTGGALTSAVGAGARGAGRLASRGGSTAGRAGASALAAGTATAAEMAILTRSQRAVVSAGARGAAVRTAAVRVGSGIAAGLSGPLAAGAAALGVAALSIHTLSEAFESTAGAVEALSGDTASTLRQIEKHLDPNKEARLAEESRLDRLRANRGALMEQARQETLGSIFRSLGFSGSLGISGGRFRRTGHFDPSEVADTKARIRGLFGSTLEEDERAIFDQMAAGFRASGVSVGGFSVGGSPDDFTFTGGRAGMTEEQLNRLDRFEDFTLALQGQRGLAGQLDAISDVMAFASAGILKELSDQAAVSFNNYDLSVAMAQAFQDVIASNVPVTVYEEGSVQIFGDLSGQIEEQLRALPSARGAALLPFLGDQ